MKIHHYTTIESLALILGSKKIRFSRIDFLDDIKEVDGFDNLFCKFDKSIFISSWTDDDEENIPLWKMYASVTNGVRISMPQDMFKKNFIPRVIERNHGMNKDLNSPFTKEETFYNGKYMIINIFDLNRGDFYKKIEYVDNWKELYESVITETGNRAEIKCLWDLGKYKSKKWNFQKEVRFSIYTKTLNPAYSHDPFRQYDADNVTQWFENPDKYIDVPLANESYKNMQITLAPCVSDAQRIIVKALIQAYGLVNQFKESELKDIIRK